MLTLANKLLNKSQSRLTPNLCLTSSPNWPNRTMNFPNGFAYLEGIYRNWRVGPRRDLQSWNWILRSPLSIDNTTKVTQHFATNVGGIQNSPFSRRFSDKPCVIDENSIKDHLTMQAIIHAYQARGHLVAEIDPLLITRGPHLKTTTPSKEVVRELTIPSDLNKVFFIGENTFIGAGEKTLPAHEIIKRLEEAYCKSIGVEFMFITDYDQIQFLKERFETPGWRAKLSSDDKKILLKRLTTGHHFESFLTRKYPSVKRFGLGGCEVLIPALRSMVDTASGFGVEHFIFGMAHRGRLNVLANVVEKSLPETLALFRSLDLEEAGTGDVKYHLGVTTSRINNKTKKPVNFTLCANPSHLECVCPIVIGKTFALQDKFGDKEKVWPILFHGDAATAGQGVVYETFHLSELPCYSTNGAMHIIINNQIGFTTDPRMSRSSVYCTAVGKVLAAPIIHVNGDDPEAVIFAMVAATDFKKKFKHSVVLDIVCYRRHGHSEFDEPMFTQPIMYKKIKALKSCLDQYSEKLIKENVLKKEDVEAILNEYDQKLEKALKDSEAIKAVDMKSWVDSPWHDFFKKEKDPLQEPVTGVKKEVLLKVGEVVSTPPPDFEIHQLLEKILAGRKKMIAENSVDFALGEAFAFGSLLEEGIQVRMTGQDAERGTFSHRHTIYHHQSKDKTSYTPLKHLSPGQGKFKICNSSLSEFGVLGFELGFSSVSPNQLVLWEAQFGDFVNTAQCMVDQFISSGEVKWRRQIGLVMLLPHGMEGQGPEHSSCRPERFLQMCADDAEEIELNMPKQLLNANWFIVNPTTPASLFHALRRQVKLNYRKPLVIFSPKSILRDPVARSPIDDMTDGTKFKPYLKDETIKDGGKVKRMYLCSGKVFYGLMNERNNRKLNEAIAISRVEQLYPFPYADIIEDANRYPNAQIFWVQEEHKNQGFWDYTKPRLFSALPKKTPIKYFGRGVSPAPATGVYILHLKELKDLMDTCFAM